MSLATISLLTIVFLFVLFLLGLEIGFAMALAGFIGFAAVVNVDAAFNLLAKDMYSAVSSYGLTVIPMFVFMGQLGASGGVARSLYDSAYKFIGHIPCGLALATVGACHGIQGHMRFLSGHCGHVRKRGSAGNGQIQLRQTTLLRYCGNSGHAGNYDSP